MEVIIDDDSWGGWDEGMDPDHSLLECRSHTILWCFQKLGINLNKNIIIELVGCDGLEGKTTDAVRTCFKTLTEKTSSSGIELKLILIGPHVPTELSNLQKISYAEDKSEFVFIKSTYEDYVKIPRPKSTAVFCFNAGIWGYDSWKPAVKSLLITSNTTPVIITSYSATECDADEEVIDNIAASLDTKQSDDSNKEVNWYLWTATRNPYRSLKQRPSSVSNEILFESHYCIALNWKGIFQTK